MIVYQIMKNGQNENTYSRAILQTASMSPNGISDFGITGYVPNNNHVYATTTSVEKMWSISALILFFLGFALRIIKSIVALSSFFTNLT